MWGLILYLFDTSAFPPRWQCGVGWQEEPFWGWLHIVSDLSVWMAYLAIPLVLAYFLRQRPDLPFPKVLWLFVAFIFACGTVHLVEASLFWWPAYRFSGVVKLATAIVSWATVYSLLPMLPLAFSFHTPAQLEEQVQQRTEELQALTKQLQREVERRAEIAKELEENTAQLRLALRAGRMGTWNWEFSKGVSMDHVERELTGFTTELVDPEEFFARVHPEDLPSLRAAIQRTIDSGKDYDHEFRLQLPDGRLQWIAGRGEVEHDEKGQAVRMRGVNYDITETRTAHDNLLASEAVLRSILDSSPDCIKVLDSERRILSMNQASLKAMEIDDFESVRGHSWKSFWPDIDPLVFDQALQSAEAGSVGRFQGVRPTLKGHLKNWDVICTKIGNGGSGPQKLLCISRDITELQNIAKAREESEVRFRVLADNIAALAWMTDENGSIVWYNKRWFDYTGTTMEQVQGWGWKIVHHPDHLERVTKKFIRCLESGSPWEDTFPLLGKDGSYRWFLSRAMPIRDAEGKVIHWFGTNTDITEQLAAERSLARAHAKLKSIFEAAPDAIMTLDDKGQILSVNSAVEHVFGCTPQELIGTPIGELIVWSNPPRPENVETNEQIVIGKSREAVGRRRDGKTIPLEVSVSVANLGKRRLYAAIIRDISKRKLTEEVLRIRLRAIEFATNGILITDAESLDNPIIYVNPAFEQLTGYSSSETLGRNCRFLQGKGTSPDAVLAIRDAIQRRTECHVTILNYRKDGSRFWNDLHISPVVDEQGRVTHFIGVQSDITGRIRYEQRLREAHEQADTANRAKSEFLANVSHEIRTPLTAILGCADSLFRQLEDPDPKDVVRMIRDQGQLLLGILNDVLDLSKIEAGKLEIHIEPCDPVRILGDVHSLMHAQAVEKGIDLRTVYLSEIPATIKTDPLRLRQILLNLVSNAIKFTEQGYVEIQLACRAVGDRMILSIAVKDTGIGIPADRIEKIFEAFVQQKNALTSRIHGTGLGLTICQRLVQMLGGTISTTSAEGSGSTFVVELPVGDVHSAQMKAPDELTRTAALRDSQMTLDTFIPCRVLIAEDTRAIQFMLTRLLKDVVTSLSVAENGELAIQAVEEAAETTRAFDVILMDMHMPVMNGFDATRKLRDLGHTLPIIALTAGAMSGDRERCLAAGCTDYLPKPIDLHELLAKLEQYCE